MELDPFKSIVAEVVGPKLSEFGYNVDVKPPETEIEVWFEKRLQPGIYIIISFQASEIAPNAYDRFAVNLDRNPYTTKIPKEELLAGYGLGGRLASWLWVEDRFSPEWESDHWWYFRNEEELRSACRDALEILVTYGLPWVEDLNSKRLSEKVK